jgi:serine/threonine protein kinase
VVDKMIKRMEQIGRYKILDEIGRGAMGVVYRAQDPAIGRVVAIKTIRLNDLVDPSEQLKLRDRLLREAQSAGILSHPGIVTIYDVAEEGGVAYIAMECVEGPTLERMVVSDPPDGRLVLDILTQTAAALDYAHKRGIVHRDIKPANIMIHERSTAKIADFGVARIQSHQMTQIGSMIGTPNYMSPEQIQGQSVDGRSDQFSLAVIAYELLTGEKPFTGESIPALAFKIVQEDPMPVHRLNQTLEWPVDTVLKRALSKKPADRYPTCSDFAFAVENACRPSKGWSPIAPGSVQNLPTLTGATSVAAAVPAAAPAPGTPAPRTRRSEDPEDSATPRVLRWARNLALVFVGAGVIGAAVIGALRWMDEAAPPPALAEVRDETAPAPPPVAERPSSVPKTPVADPPRPETAEIAPQEPRPEPPRTEQPKPVRLVTNPPGAKLVLDGDGTNTCTSPCSLELRPGRHTIAATLDGYRRTLRIFEAPAETDVFMNLDRTSGNVIVRSEPRGATIVVDGQTRSEKTPVMLTLPTGKHTIEIVQDNQRETHEVVVRESVIANLSINMVDR